jgi:hypothetical protein
MKNFQSITEGVWMEQVVIQLTEAEKELMMSEDIEDDASKKTLLDRLKEEKEKSIISEKSDSLTAFYIGIKPRIKETDLYELISCDYIEKDENSYSGILNYRINGEQKQLRFNCTL